MESLRKYLPLGLLVVLIFAAIIAYFLLFKSKTTSVPNNNNMNANTNNTNTNNDVVSEDLTTVDPDSVVNSAKENYRVAFQKAREWRQDAYFVAFSLKLTSVELESGNETYVFDSPSDPSNHFVVTIAQKSKRYLRAIIPQTDYLGAGLLPVDAKFWKISYAGALQIAEKNGGYEFRDSHLDWTLELTLKRDEPNGWLWWFVEYGQKDQSNSLTVQINAYTGEVISNNNSGSENS